jgi:hypothetical protein
MRKSSVVNSEYAEKQKSLRRGGPYILDLWQVRATVIIGLHVAHSGMGRDDLKRNRKEPAENTGEKACEPRERGVSKKVVSTNDLIADDHRVGRWG